MGIDNQGSGKPSPYLDTTTPSLEPRVGLAGALEKTVVNTLLSPNGQLRPGEIVDHKYRIEALVGRGGMAEVYRATDINLSRYVALKVMLHAHNDDEQMATRFEQEARAVALLPTDRVVQIHELGRLSDSRPYMVLCFAEGTTLADALAAGPICWQQALRIASEICEGLAFAHDRCVLHRDIKPSNIMLLETDDQKIQIKILDFGIAKIMCSDDPNSQRLTRTGEIFGSPMYMSPEQCAPGKGIDERTDIYALGCVLYEMLSGDPPFIGDTAMMTMYMHSHEEPRKLETPEGFEPFLPGVDQVVRKALEKDPDRRYQSMLEFKDALNEFLTASPVRRDYLTNVGLTGTVSELSNIANRIRSDRAAKKAEKKRKRNRMMALVTIVGVCLGANGLSSIHKWTAVHPEEKRSIASSYSRVDGDDNDSAGSADTKKHAKNKKHSSHIEMTGASGLKITDGDETVSIGADGINISERTAAKSTEVALTGKGINVSEHGTKKPAANAKESSANEAVPAVPLGGGTGGAILHDEF